MKNKTGIVTENRGSIITLFKMLWNPEQEEKELEEFAGDSSLTSEQLKELNKSQKNIEKLEKEASQFEKRSEDKEKNKKEKFKQEARNNSRNNLKVEQVLKSSKMNENQKERE